MTSAPNVLPLADLHCSLTLSETIFAEAYERPDALAPVAAAGGDPVARELIDSAEAVLDNPISDGARG
jgi:hypothetical protein